MSDAKPNSKGRLLSKITLTAMPFTLWCPTVSAFFPPIHQQTPPVSPPTVVEPPTIAPPIVVVPPPPTPPVTPPPPPPPIVDPCECTCRCQVPEPSSIIIGATGLVAAAGYRWRKRAR